MCVLFGARRGPKSHAALLCFCMESVDVLLCLATVLTEEPKAHFHQHSHLFQLVADSVGSRGLVSLDT